MTIGTDGLLVCAALMVSRFPAGLTSAATWGRDKGQGPLLCAQQSYGSTVHAHDHGVHILVGLFQLSQILEAFQLAPVAAGCEYWRTHSKLHAAFGRSVLRGRAWEGTFADPYAWGETSLSGCRGYASRLVPTLWLAWHVDSSIA
ncbi:hypothetical protein BDP27DRAFT_254564 [Rhodocollybia butyracea]|uniref:Secreted protein n=1 Tax=Rhodocollybia butyracea TaxID=206335 RepID=A0A9P5PGR8_9AGAR|nr:hypothetical protein BDP27DRAFT_254564 [Rhodocollybia butyracea]